MAKGKGDGESVAGYFRKVFAANPKLLWERSNDELFKRWLDDHPGHSTVPAKVKANLQNIKSVLRKKGRKRRGGRPKKSAAAPVATNAVAIIQVTETVTGSPLEGLEVAIDDCMVMARGIDPEELHEVIAHLRRARNAVVWMQGQ
jgi:hypothetical protein